MTRATRCCTLLLIAILIGVTTFPLLASDKKPSDVMTKLQRDEALQMLQDTAEKVRQQYYDPTFHAEDFEGRYKEAEQRIRKADTLSEAFGVIAWFLDGLNDSHTFFIPPARPYLVEDGWEAKFIGEIC